MYRSSLDSAGLVHINEIKNCTDHVSCFQSTDKHEHDLVITRI